MTNTAINWRETLADSDIDPDDQELKATPKDVLDVLGFDPKEFSEQAEENEKANLPNV